MQKGGWYWATINIEDLGGAPKTFVNRGMKTNWNLALFQTLAIPKDDSLVLHPPPNPPNCTYGITLFVYISCQLQRWVGMSNGFCGERGKKGGLIGKAKAHRREMPFS